MAADQPIQGWEETVPVDSGTVLRSQQHGAWPGRLLSQARTVTLTLIGRCEPGQASAAARALAAKTPPDSTAELPFVVQLDDMPMLAWGRVVRRYVPPSTASRNGLIKGASLQIVCSDPRRYVVTESTASAVLPIAETGLSFGSPTETGLNFGSPTEVGLDFGTPGSTGDLIVTNSGTTAAHPVVEIRGPVTTPTVTLGALRLEYDITLGAADTLIVDTWAGTVTLGGQDRLYTATSRSAPEGLFTVPPGTNTISFRADPSSTDPAAQATVRWRSAYL
ncbi:phage tail domain-containing protein [Streptomyces sp. LS1784]|uniref:phage distal tail protein n=1 Tax=Streptomyces sp. LS1784 TaxID=2851533 RepID=UPI001CCAB9AB|nr:phage tail domain-containing protein [Streptomyces sp. LS1784]